MTNPSEENRPKLDLLSFAFGTEFNECSIAAAELNKQVQSVLEGRYLKQRVLYTIGEDPTIGKEFDTYQLECDMSNESGDKFRLALIKPTNPLRGRRAIFRRAIEKTADITGREPSLVAILDNQDAFLTIATFARREGGTCSYVQLGSEVKDDSLFVTAADEGTSRQDVIEGIRKIVSGDTKTKLLSPLLYNELLGKDEQLAKAKEAMLVRRVYELATSKKSSKITILDEQGGEHIQQDLYINGLQYRVELEDTRKVNLVLARDLDTGLLLLATTRDNLGLPIASFDTTNGTLKLLGLETALSQDKRRQFINSLQILISTFSSQKTVKWNHSQKRHDHFNRVDLIIARHLNDLGLIRLSEINEYNYKIDLKKVNEKEITKEVDLYLENPNSPLPYKSQQALTEFMVNNSRNKNGADICGLVDLSGRIDRTIGDSSTNEELLFGKIWSMVNKGTLFSAIANNVQLGKTIGDARLYAEIHRDGSLYSLIISGAPLAMPDEAPRPIIRLDFDSNQSIFDRNKLKDPSTRALDILDILNLFQYPNDLNNQTLFLDSVYGRGHK